MASHYLQILQLHIGAVALSGSLFAIRGLLRIVEHPLANHRAVRFLSYVIDSTLLAAAILLTLIIHQFPLVNDWLTAKLLLLVVYIVLGTFALKRARTRAGRVVALLAALMVFGFIVGIAVRHHPAGWLASISASAPAR